jgi:hypothetical protein
MYTLFQNIRPVGQKKIEVRRLNSDDYFWYVYGKVEFFIKEITSRKEPERVLKNYFLVIRFNKDSAKANVDFFIIEDFVITNNLKILDKISKEATELLAKKNKEAFNIVKSKKEWTIDRNTESGTFENYRNGRVTLRKNNATTPIEIKRFSYEDQILIRGYIDHQGIPR